ncbi:hypothetical protein ACFZAG_01785 [Streptomyces sp. NPDC012403]|uniref:hypothetical protein n=1 Tax=Streptomyces sp. NPDC012403 TaxID=3364831 RepID=UPI0036E95B03
MAEDVVGTPWHLCPPGQECAACRVYERQQREHKDAEARRILDERSARKEWGGKWPCYYGWVCATKGDTESRLHDPSEMVLIIAERAMRYRVRLKDIGDTGRAVVCRPCHQHMRDRTLFDDYYPNLRGKRYDLV